MYVPVGSPVFPSRTSLLVSEWDANVVTTYQIDAGGNPVPATRDVFITGLTGAEGAIIDPLTGDFLFSTFVSGGAALALEPSAPLARGQIAAIWSQLGEPEKELELRQAELRRALGRADLRQGQPRG